MKRKSLPLIKTNPYLREPAECDAWLIRSIVSSSAIEGVHTAARRALGVGKKVMKAKILHSRSKSCESHR
jgi:hypothetical protein